MSSSSVVALLAEGARRLHGPEARFEAELLLCHALRRERAWLFAHAEDAVAAEQQDRFLALCQRRAEGHPVAHLLGSRGFWTLELEVTADTLVPRPDTELLVEAALERIPAERTVHVADLGTGTGAIALAIASERPLACVLATDASAAALTVAQRNARRNRITTVRFAEGDWLAPLDGQHYHLIASNPPYIPDRDPHLLQGDLRFEPRAALASGGDGLDALRTIIHGAPQLLLHAGWLLVEHGHDQSAAVRDLFSRAGFTGITTLQDLEQRDRVTLGQRG